MACCLCAFVLPLIGDDVKGVELVFGGEKEKSISFLFFRKAQKT